MSKKQKKYYGDYEGKKKKRLFRAEEVCYGLCIGIQLGFSDKEILEWVHEDLMKWTKFTLPKESNDGKPV